MNRASVQIFVSFLFLLNSCITQFIPEANVSKELLVVEGLITDQPGPYTIKLTATLPLGTRGKPNPLKGSHVLVTDDLGNRFTFVETDTGIFVSDPLKFRGVVGRFYSLHISTGNAVINHNYESSPVEMKPVPPIDSIYYEKVELPQNSLWFQRNPEGCQVYLNTYDPSGQCRFYRWEYTETWEFRLRYSVPNNTCWATSHSDKINIKSVVNLAESRILNYPLNFVSNLTERLKFKYSMLVNQYSINEDEYSYWEKLQNVSEQVGGLYDMIPSAIASNVYCIDNPDEKVLGYFSVSAVSSKRLFVKDNFYGLVQLYTDDDCKAGTIWGDVNIPGLGVYIWVIEEGFMPRYRVITYTHGCADCTTRGTTQEPSFWKDYK